MPGYFCHFMKCPIELEISENDPRGDKVSMTQHDSHKPLRKIKVTTCNHQADSPLFVWPYV